MTAPAPTQGLTFRQAVEDYIGGRRARGELGETSTRHLRSRLLLFGRSYGADRPVAGLDRAAVLSWQETIGGFRPSTRRTYLSSVKVFCGWLVAEGHLDADPTVRVTRIREPRRVPRALSAGAVSELLAVCAGDARRLAIVGLMLECGLRCVEVARLDVADYDRRDRILFVRGKADHERVVPVPDETARALEAYLGSVGWPPGALIRKRHTRRNRPRPALDGWADLIRAMVVADRDLPAQERRSARTIWRTLVEEHDARIGQSTVRNQVNAVNAGLDRRPLPDRVTSRDLSIELSSVMAQAGLKRGRYDGVSAHALRHTCASDVLDRCHDVRTVQQLLGHASLATTEIYLRRAHLGQLREAMAGRSYGLGGPPVAEGPRSIELTTAEMAEMLHRLEGLVEGLIVNSAS